jgi:hypothetical protein
MRRVSKMYLQSAWVRTSQLSNSSIVLVSIFVGALAGIPILSTPYVGDEVWAVYLFGGQQKGELPQMALRQMKDSLFWIQGGNFRPIGRLFEHLGYSYAINLSEVAGIAPNVSYGLIRLFMVVVFFATLSFVILHLPYGEKHARQLMALVTILLVPMFFTITDSSGPFRAFPFFYTTSFVIVLLTIFSAISLNGLANKWIGVLGFAFIGLIAASFNEITYIGVFVLFARLSWGILQQKSILFISEARNRSTIIILMGFASIFIPSRIAIYNYCKGGNCYSPSDATFDNYSISTVLTRAIGIFPPFTQNNYSSYGEIGISNFRFSFYVGLLLLVNAFICVILSSKMVAYSKDFERFTFFYVKLGSTLILITASIFTTSRMLQSWPSNDLMARSWKDSGLLITGWSLLLGGVVINILVRYSLKNSYKKSFLYFLLFALTSFCTFQSASINSGITYSYNQTEQAKITQELETSLLYFSLDDEDNFNRCKLLEESVLISGESVSQALRQGLDILSIEVNGREFCK